MHLDGRPVYMGGEAGFVIEGGGRSVYFSGDTDVHADMAIINDLRAPDTGILCIGGHFTMDQKRAAYARKKFFDFKTVVPCRHKTFPFLAQNSEDLAVAIAPTKLVDLQIMAGADI